MTDATPEHDTSITPAVLGDAERIVNGETLDGVAVAVVVQAFMNEVERLQASNRSLEAQVSELEQENAELHSGLDFWEDGFDDQRGKGLQVLDPSALL